MKVIFNGSLVAQEQSQCSTLGWLEGTGIFETVKTVDGNPWALTRHMRRAVNSAAKENIHLPSEELLRNSISQLLQEESYDFGFLRISFGATGNWAVVHLPYKQVHTPAKICTDPIGQVNNGVAVKSYPYDHRLDILQQARTAGFDEALITNTDGKICEGAVTNILLRIAGKWCTPPLSDGVLPGIMRALVVENFDVKVRSIAVSEIHDIEAAFLLSSLRIAQPVASIDGRELLQSDEFRVEIEAMALRTSVG
jgi:branched-chain amino acid aminotransferase